MNKALNTAEARVFFGTEKVFEIGQGFLYDCTGKYKPNMSFLLPFQFELDAAGKLVNPLTYISDPAVTDSFNLRLDGDASFLFGDFWRSKKGGACFRPKDPQQAKHLLVRVDWGGCFNRSRGQKEGYAEEAGAHTHRVCYVGRLKLGDVGFSLDGWSSYYYDETGLQKAEQYLQRRRQAVQEVLDEEETQRQARAYFAPRLEALQSRAKAAGLQISTADWDKASLKTISGDFVADPTYSAEGVQLCESWIRQKELKLQEEARCQAKLDAEAAAKAAGLPSDVQVWKRVGGRTGCSKGWVISVDGVDRERDRLYNENARRAQRYDEGYEIWNQILPGELVVSWSKACTAAEHKLEVIYRPERVTEAQLERLAELLEEINADWCDCTGLVSKTPSPLINIEEFLAQFVA